MSTLGFPQLRQVSGAIERPSLSSLKTAEEVAKVVRMPTRRILELSHAQVLPHFRIDGGEPLFNVQQLRSYVRRYLTAEFEGAPLPLDLRPVVITPVAKPVPVELVIVQDRLCECPAIHIPPCVYFLIDGEHVVYVGQSRNLAGRLIQHKQDGKTWERVLFLPVPESELFRVESEWILTLRPPLNRTGVSEDKS